MEDLREILLGLIDFWWVEWSLLFWAPCFGVLHILSGILIYRKYPS